MATKLCECGCGKPTTARWARGHHPKQPGWLMIKCNCGERAVTRGLCKLCYMRAYRMGQPMPLDPKAVSDAS